MLIDDDPSMFTDEEREDIACSFVDDIRRSLSNLCELYPEDFEKLLVCIARRIETMIGEELE